MYYPENHQNSKTMIKREGTKKRKVFKRKKMRKTPQA